MIAELNVGHAYVGGGEMPRAPRVQMGLLGAELERDNKTGYYRIKKILRGANWDRRLRSPLTEPGVKVRRLATLAQAMDIGGRTLPGDRG